MLSPRILAEQALLLIDHAIALHDTNRNLYDHGHYVRWNLQEIKKTHLLFCAQILRKEYLAEQREGPILPLLPGEISVRSR